MMYYRFCITCFLLISHDNTHLTLLRQMELVLLQFEYKKNAFKLSLFPLWGFSSFRFIYDNFLLLLTILFLTRAFENPKDLLTWSLKFFV